jgi:hypothetical protein
MGNIVFTLVMFLNNGTSYTAAVYPTQESCHKAAQGVNLDLRDNPDRFRVGVACVPTNQITMQDVQRQMQELFVIVRDLDSDQGRVTPCQ